MSVLITAGISPEAYRLQRVLDRKDIVFSDEVPLPHIPGTRSTVLPHHETASFVHELLKACLDLGISRVYPLNLGEVLELSKARTLFTEYGIILMIPSENWLRDHASKSYGRLEYISVIEHGKLLAGSNFPHSLPLAGETGVFTWATIGQELEYSLYLV